MVSLLVKICKNKINTNDTNIEIIKFNQINKIKFYIFIIDQLKNTLYFYIIY